MGARLDLLNRYRQTWRHAWKHRHAMNAPQRLTHEAQFLPPALALQDTPVHPAPRLIQWAILAFAVLALLWSYVGEIDVVATASGRIVPSGKSKVIQPSEVAVVKAIHVQDGQPVTTGDLLIELDASMTGADVERLKSDLLSAEIDSVRATALLEAIEEKREPASLAETLPDASPAQRQAVQRWLQGQYLELHSQLQQSDAEIDQRTAEIQAARAWGEKLEESLPITRQLAADYKCLLDKAYIAKHAYLEKEQLRLEQERELAIQRARVQELSAARQEAEHRRSVVIAQTRRAMLDLQQQGEQRAAALHQELAKARQRDRLTRLTAPR